MEYCHCGNPIAKQSYETLRQFEKRKAKGVCRAKCSRTSTPAPRSRPKPTLGHLRGNYARGEGVPQAKERTPRSEPYKAFIREQPCILQGQFCQCTGDVIPHHTEGGGMSLKGSDLSCVPLCASHHLLMDAAGKKGRGIWTPSQLTIIINRLNEEYNRILADKKGV